MEIIDELNDIFYNVQTLLDLQKLKSDFDILYKQKEIELSLQTQIDIETKNIFFFVDYMTEKMKELNLNEKDVSIGSGVSLTTVKRCLRGVNSYDKVNFPTVRIRDKIVNFLKEKEKNANNLQ